MTARSPFLIRQFIGKQMAALPPAVTGSRHILYLFVTVSLQQQQQQQQQLY